MEVSASKWEPLTGRQRQQLLNAHIVKFSEGNRNGVTRRLSSDGLASHWQLAPGAEDEEQDRAMEGLHLSGARPPQCRANQRRRKLSISTF